MEPVGEKREQCPERLPQTAGLQWLLTDATGGSSSHPEPFKRHVGRIGIENGRRDNFPGHSDDASLIGRRVVIGG